MSKISEAIKDNFKLIIVTSLVIIIALVVVIIKKSTPEPTYNPEINEQNDINYVKKNYQVNEYSVVDVPIEDLLNSYLNKFLTLQKNKPEEAFNMLSDESKKTFENDVKKYKKYIKENTTIYTKNNKVTKYIVNKNKNTYEIIDTENFKYEIKEYATWNIKFTLQGKA